MTPVTVTAVPMPAGYVPLHPKDRGLVANPTSTTAHAAALRAVLLHLMCDTWDLKEEEALWAGYRLDAILSPLLDKLPHSVPFAVRQEMIDGTYSRLVALRAKAHMVRGHVTFDSRIPQPTFNEWVETLINPIDLSYDLTVATVANMRSEIAQLLTDLGVGARVNPRGATHVPNDLRNRMFADRSKG